MSHALRSVRNFALYYGWGGEEPLSHFDLAIVDPGGRDADGVKRLKQRGSIALGYLSVLEVPRRSGLPPANVLRFNGAPVEKTEFQNWILDPRSPQTLRRFKEDAEKVLHLGYDGFFLDTIGDIEDRRFPPPFMAELVPAAARLVSELVRQFPGRVVVQNWGLHHLLPLTASLLDGVCWEDFPYAQVGPVPSIHSGIRVLNNFQDQTGLRVLALNHSLTGPETAQDARAAAQRCGFIWYGIESYLHLPQELPR